MEPWYKSSEIGTNWWDSAFSHSQFSVRNHLSLFSSTLGFLPNSWPLNQLIPSHLLLHQDSEIDGVGWAAWVWLIRVRRHWHAEGKSQIGKGKERRKKLVLLFSPHLGVFSCWQKTWASSNCVFDAHIYPEALLLFWDPGLSIQLPAFVASLIS